MADYNQVIEALRKADAAGNVEDAKRLAEIANGMKLSSEFTHEKPQGPSAADVRRDFFQGIPEGASDVGRAYAQFLAKLNVGVTSASPLAGEEIEADARRTAENVEQRIAEGSQQFEESRDPQLQGQPNVGRTLGSIATTLPLAAVPGGAAASFGTRAVAGAAGGGAAAALSEPVEPGTPNYWREQGLRVLLGAGLGAGSVAAGSVAGRLISPRSSPQVQALRREGVAPTPGQTLGGIARDVEEKAKSVPLLGDAIRSAERRAILSANRGAVNRALKDADLELPKEIEPGAMAIGWAQDALGGAYDDVLSRTQIKVDQQFVKDFAAVQRGVSDKLPEPMQQAFDNIVESVRLPSTSGRVWPGEDVKTILSRLGTEAETLKGSGNILERQLGLKVEELKNAVKNAATRSSSPDDAARIIQIDKSWTKFVRVQAAASTKGAKGGVFTGSQLLSAVRNQDKSVRKGNFARGRATEQEFAESMRDVLGNNVPDSGTAGRMLLPMMLSGGAGAAGTVAPTATLGVLGAAGLASAPYVSGLGQRGFAAALAGRQGPTFKALAASVRGLGRVAAPALGAASGGTDRQDIIDYLRR